MRHAQRRGRRREEELPVAVAAGRRRREHGRFVEEDSERPLAARDARRVHPERAGDEPGGQALLRPRGVLRPLSKAERPRRHELDADVRPGPGSRPRRDERREAVEQHVHRGARRVVDAVKQLQRRGPAPRDLLVADRREPSGQRRDVALAVAHDGSIPVERVAERQRKLVRDDDRDAAGRERLVEAARRRRITRRNQTERRVARPGRRVQEVPARSVARRAFHGFPTHLRNALVAVLDEGDVGALDVPERGGDGVARARALLARGAQEDARPRRGLQRGGVQRGGDEARRLDEVGRHDRPRPRHEDLLAVVAVRALEVRHDQPVVHQTPAPGVDHARRRDVQ